MPEPTTDQQVTYGDSCLESRRADGKHSWKFDGDDPYVVCVFCKESRDAITGKPVPAPVPESSLQPKAAITTNEPWHPDMGWSPAPLIVDETFNYVVSEIGREGVTWLRLHVDERELWINLANVVSIGQVVSDAS